MRALSACVLVWLLFGVAYGHAQFTFITNSGTITITSSSAVGEVTIPSTINGLPVTAIGVGSQVFPDGNLTSLTIPDRVMSIGANACLNSQNLACVTIGNGLTTIDASAFYQCFSLTNVIIGSALTNIGAYAFEGCSSLATVYFAGNAPASGSFVFGDDGATVYYLPGTIGWGSTFGGTPGFGGAATTYWVLPCPVITNPGLSGSPPTRQFGFTVSWATNATVVVDASTNLLNPAWQSLQTNSLTTGSFPFSESFSTNYQARFYRVRSQ